MNLSEYQALVARVIVYPRDSIFSSDYCYLGLVGEGGEVANHLKKHLCRGNPLDREYLALELGDCCYYLAQAATEMEIDLGTLDIQAGNTDVGNAVAVYFRSCMELDGDIRPPSSRGWCAKTTAPKIAQAISSVFSIGAAFGIEVDEILHLNVAKQKTRYPDRYLNL